MSRRRLFLAFTVVSGAIGWLFNIAGAPDDTQQLLAWSKLTWGLISSNPATSIALSVALISFVLGILPNRKWDRLVHGVKTVPYNIYRHLGARSEKEKRFEGEQHAHSLIVESEAFPSGKLGIKLEDYSWSKTKAIFTLGEGGLREGPSLLTLALTFRAKHAIEIQDVQLLFRDRIIGINEFQRIQLSQTLTRSLSFEVPSEIMTENASYTTQVRAKANGVWNPSPEYRIQYPKP